MSTLVKSDLVYLCGPITGATFEECRFGWRQDVAKQLYMEGIQTLNPIRQLKIKEMKLDNLGKMPSGGAEVGVLSTGRGLTERDRFDTFRSTLIFCNLLGATKISVGSMIELGWADAKRIPIVACMEEDNLHRHGMVEALCPWIVPTLEEGIQTVLDLLVLDNQYER